MSTPTANLVSAASVAPWKPGSPALTGAALEALVKGPKKGIDCIVPQFIYRGKTSVIYGDPNMGKTTIASNIAGCLSAGVPVFDKLEVKPMRVYVALFETEAEEMAESLASIHDKIPINWNNIAIDTDLVGVNVAEWTHAQAAIKRIALFKPDAVIIDPIYMLTKGGLSKDEPCAVVMQFLREICHTCKCGTLAYHHAKKEQFDESGKRLQGNYYGAIWIKAHCRIMWHIDRIDGSTRLLTREKDNLGVCQEKITLYYDHQSCTCTMKEEGDATAKGRLLTYLLTLKPGDATTTDLIADALGISRRTLKNLFNDPAILEHITLERKPGRPTMWKRKGIIV